jgi:transcriptional regulator NrdR family protein
LCRDTFTTKESAFADNLFIIKRNKSRERLIYEKLFISIFVSLNTKKGGDNGTNALLAKKITERIIQKVLMLPAAHSNVPTSLLISLVYSELRKIGKSFADHYMYYSEYRQQVARKMGLI